MNKLSKEMTKREKIMLAVLVVVIIALGWFKLIFEPINNEIDTINSNRDAEQSEIDANFITLANLGKMERSLSEYKENNIQPIMPVADNSKALLVKLNDVMSLADSYTIDFGTAEQDDYLINRKVTLTFATETYEKARTIIDKLNAETYINQISDVQIDIEGEKTSVTLTITFFEVIQ